MALVTKNDLLTFINTDELEAISNCSDTNIEKAIYQAEAKACSFLIREYCVEEIFNPTDTAERDALLVEYVSYLALYLLYNKHAKSKVPDDRFLQYNEAMDWLKDVNKGEIGTKLPRRCDGETEDIQGSLFRFSSDKQYETDF